MRMLALSATAASFVPCAPSSAPTSAEEAVELDEVDLCNSTLADLELLEAEEVARRSAELLLFDDEPKKKKAPLQPVAVNVASLLASRSKGKAKGKGRKPQSAAAAAAKAEAATRKKAAGKVSKSFGQSGPGRCAKVGKSPNDKCLP